MATKTSSKKIYVIIASTRPHWLGKQVARWVTSAAAKHSTFKHEIIDLEDYNLPFLQNPFRRRDRVQKWHRQYDDAMGFIFVTPEYEYGHPEPLKKAVNYLQNQWSNLPVAFVSYGFRDGKQAVTQLKDTVSTLNMKTVDQSVHIQNPWEYMDEEGHMLNPEYNGSLKAMMNQLNKWAEELAGPTLAYQKA